MLQHPEKSVVVATDSIPRIKPAESQQGFGPLKCGLVGHAREAAGQMVAADFAPRESPRGGLASILLHHLHTTVVDTVTRIGCDPPPGVGEYVGVVKPIVRAEDEHVLVVTDMS